MSQADTLLKLVEMANAADLSRLTLEQLAEKLERPDWDSGGRVHNWKNHVRSELKEVWADLTLETRLAVFALAAKQANDEEWD